MGFAFFKEPSHKVFNYKPRFYDPAKEELERKIDEAERQSRGEYVPGAAIRGSFQRMRMESKRSRAVSPAKRILTLITIAIILLALFYFSEYMGLFF